MVAIIQLANKQYSALPGQAFLVDRLPEAVGTTKTATNLLSGQNVTLKIIGHELGDKVISRKFRNKTRSHKVRGHRQMLTRVSYETAETKPDPVKAAKPATKSRSTKKAVPAS